MAKGPGRTSDTPTTRTSTSTTDAEGSGPASAGPDAPAPEFADVADLSYESARDELSSIVARLEGGQVPLEEGMRLWRRGEALAAHCTAWLDGAQRQISEAGPASAP